MHLGGLTLQLGFTIGKHGWNFSPVFYRTASPIGSAALPPKRSNVSKWAGQGNRCPYDAFGRLVPSAPLSQTETDR